jgi:hypothetical protein
MCFGGSFENVGRFCIQIIEQVCSGSSSTLKKERLEIIDEGCGLCRTEDA